VCDNITTLEQQDGILRLCRMIGRIGRMSNQSITHQHINTHQQGVSKMDTEQMLRGGERNMCETVDSKAR